MSGFNGSGIFNISGVGLPYVSGTVISSSVANTLNTDLAAGLSKCILNDGQQTIYANIPWNNYNINNLSAVGIGTSTPLGQLQIVNGATTNLIVTSGGSVGIGTSSTPSSSNAKLVISGATDSGVQFASTSTGGGLILGAPSGGLRFYTYTGSIGSESYTESMRIDSSGNLGVGTASPDAHLHLYSTVAQTIKFTQTSGATKILLGNQDSLGTNKPSIIESSNANLIFGYGNSWATDGGTFTELMYLDSSGNLGIGATPNGAYKLQVNGGGLLTGINVSNGGGYNSANTATFDTNGTGTARFYSRGSNSSTVGSFEWHEQSSDGTIDNVKMTLDTSGYLTLATAPAIGDNSSKVPTTSWVQSTVGTSKLQPLTTSGSGSITITLAPTTLDFRNTASAGGAVSTINLASNASISVSGAATLGFVNGTAGRIAVLAINNSGTIELAVVNANGGINLDENSLITTSAVSGGTSAATVYSTTAITSAKAYRVVGYVDATNTSSSWTASYTGAGASLPIVQAPIKMAKAWVNFDGTSSGTITPRANFNVGSITKNSTGDYTLNFTTAFASANYTAACNAGDPGGTYAGSNILVTAPYSTVPTTSACRVLISIPGTGFPDVKYISCVFFGI